MSDDVTIPRDEVARIIGEACGEASMCWLPRPTGEFDATRAEAVVERATDDVLALFGGNGDE